MGLMHVRDLDAWQAWQDSRNRLRRLRRRLRPHTPPSLTLHTRTGASSGRVLIGIDSASPTSLAGLLDAVSHLRAGVDVLAPKALQTPVLDGPGWTRQHLSNPHTQLSGRGIDRVLTLGWHLPVGRAVHDWAHTSGAASAVVQHGALTPFAPPLPEETTLLAWSAADAEFYRGSRTDITTEVVGSALLWNAARLRDDRTDAGPRRTASVRRPVFLGQMHGAELPRRISAGDAIDFCSRAGAGYRPHPAETDVLSRLTHCAMRAAGIAVDTDADNLAATDRPVVAIFSTGVLEAAAAGLPAWVHSPHAPVWVREFWDRYGMRPWGSEPTPPLPLPDTHPAQRIAHALEALT